MKKMMLMSLLAVLPLAAAQESNSAASDAQTSRREAHRQRLIQKFDVNKDGKLDAQEKAEMDKFIAEHRKNGPRRGAEGSRRGHGPSREDLIKKFDKNQDGKLDDAERAEMEKALREQRRRGPQGESASPRPAQQN